MPTEPLPYAGINLVAHDGCPCGHPSCKDRHLIGIGKFVQGSGFTPEEAQEVCWAINVWRAINVLREAEGDDVRILCDNPEPPPGAAVECNGGWTGYVNRRFDGINVMAALCAALAAKREADITGHPDPTQVRDQKLELFSEAMDRFATYCHEGKAEKAALERLTMIEMYRKELGL